MANKLKPLEELEFKDDFMFGAVMTNRDICRRFLEVVLEVPIERIEFAQSQKIIDVAAFGKSVRLDVYLKDEQKTIYSVEMQQTKVDDLPKRSRYYQAMSDLDELDKGKPYSDLNKCFIIFVCAFDPFKKKKQMYTFKYQCQEHPNLLLGDETVKIFLNARGEKGQVSQELDALLSYILHPEEIYEQQSQLVKIIADEVKSVRISEKWRREYMALGILLRNTREEGLRQGLRQGRREGVQQGREQCCTEMVLRMVSQNKSSEEIAAVLGLTPAKVDCMIAQNQEDLTQ